MNDALNALYAQLRAQARLHNAVAASVLENGSRLFVYPLADGVLLGVGACAAGAPPLRAETLLRRRGGDLRRFGAWLPTLFNDGSWYLVRHCAESEADGLDAGAWRAAEELLQ